MWIATEQYPKLSKYILVQCKDIMALSSFLKSLVSDKTQSKALTYFFRCVCVCAKSQISLAQISRMKTTALYVD